ncbi:hypothetical protein AMAG_12026 [Allomyces macrogynus ATCC 38327]|uniref:UBA domain-containing protein n=1 Tax=Allomyces macrogynus (strain ATCC 38327) TaxID=578462 RepID=A0A0L0SZ38_ALLM3|nr:hypothetical protein AMAG_12026 [Allomyces macrogynus ATCC 38327]|eukprot:KNE67574.1 hypothetical protein AMAG_12026 [Allomyces macrogynus ATCC 38327]
MSPKPAAAAAVVASPTPAPATIKRSTTPFDTDLLALLDDAPAATMPAAAAAPATPATPAPVPTAATPATKPATAASVSESLFDLTFPSPSQLPSLPVSPTPLPREVTDALARGLPCPRPRRSTRLLPTPLLCPRPRPHLTQRSKIAKRSRGSRPCHRQGRPRSPHRTEGADTYFLAVAPAAATPAPTAGPAEEADPVAAVMALGFTREQAVDALDRYDNDPEKATNYLIDQAAQ